MKKKREDVTTNIEACHDDEVMKLEGNDVSSKELMCLSLRRN